MKFILTILLLFSAALMLTAQDTPALRHSRQAELEKEAQEKVDEIIRITEEAKKNLRGGATSSTNNEPSIDNNQSNLSNGSPSTDMYNTPSRFDAKEENYDRYKNSPHFKDLGFVPGRDNETLYRLREEATEKERMKKALQIGGLLLGLGAILAFAFKSKWQN